MFRERYEYFKRKNESVLVVGLDSDIHRINANLFDFNKHIIDETKDNVCGFKINIAFYEEAGEEGFKELKRTIDYIKKLEMPIILDVKRGDIANTAKAYARAYFKRLKVDSITVMPYMGSDSMKPYLELENSHLFVVALSSNPGAEEFEIPESLYLKVVSRVNELNRKYKNRVGVVVGATQTEYVRKVRETGNDLLWLVPGIGSQGGNLKKFFESSSGYDNVLINSSRKIIFSENPRLESQKLKDEINLYRRKYEN